MPSLDRRQFLGASAALPLGPPRAAAEIRTISLKPGEYHGWPTLTRRRDGKLVLVYSGGREAHVCPFGRVEMMTSDDEGRSWSWPRVLLDGPIDDRDAGIVETAKGTLLVTSFSSLAYTERLRRLQPGPQQERWQAAHRRASAVRRKQALGVWMTRSTDGGLSWSGRYPCLLNAPHGPINLADGSLLYAGKRLWNDNKPGFARSIDDGRSWQWLADLPVRKGDEADQYHELHAVQCRSGRIVAQIRNHNPQHKGETLQCHSLDGGKTWSEPRSIGVWGLPSHLLRLRSGRLLMSYGHRRKPFGNQARYSDDDGATWSKPRSISADGIGGDLGYPSTVELKDGGLLSVWYERLRGSPRAVLRQARWGF